MTVIPFRGKLMRLEVHFDNRSQVIEITPEVLETGQPLFARMDHDMDAGWKMGPEFIENPTRVMRGQIAASRLLLAIEQGNEAMTKAMVGYIVSRLPEVHSVYINTAGEPLSTDLRTASGHSLEP